MITSDRMNQSNDLESYYEQFYSNRDNSQLVLYIHANQQMTLDASNSSFSFKNNQKRNQFVQNFPNLNFTNYRLRDISQIKEENTSEIANSIKQTFNTKFNEISKSMANNTLLNTTLQSQFNKILYKLKYQSKFNEQKQKQKQKINSEEGTSQREYLKALIQRFLQIFQKTIDSDSIQKMIKYGSIDIIAAKPIIANDTSFKQRLTQILNNCKTFTLNKKYDGHDITKQQNKMKRQLTKCLIELKFNEATAEDIFIELMKNPLSNCVALHANLTNEQKKNFYNSAFWQNKLLQTYSQIINYEQTLQYKAKQQQSLILKSIESNIKMQQDILNNIMTYNFYELLKSTKIGNIKKDIYQSIVQECSNFLKAYNLIKYQAKDPLSFKQIQLINKKFQLRDLFLQINLSFEDWQLVEKKLFQRDYNIIDKLALKRDAKQQLINHILDKIEPYFHSEQKIMNYKGQIQSILLKNFMDSELQNFKFDKILIITSQTLDSQNFRSQIMESQSKSNHRAYEAALNNQQFKKYCENKRRDVSQQNYVEKFELIKNIYKINFSEQIDVTFKSIYQFASYVVNNNNTIPNEYNQYITNLKELNKLKKSSMIEQIEPEEQTCNQPQNKKSLAELEQQFSSQVNNFIQKYNKNVEDNVLTKILQNLFKGDKVSLVKQIIELKAFYSNQSSFFSKLEGLNKVQLMKVQNQFKNNGSKFESQLSKLDQKYNEVKNVKQNVKISSNNNSPVKLNPQNNLKKQSLQSSQKNIKQIKQILQKEFSKLSLQFSSTYMEKVEDNIYSKILQKQFNGNQTQLVKKIISQNAFGDNNSQFFNELQGLNKVQLMKIKKQFKQNGSKFEDKLALLKSKLTQIQNI